MYGLQATFLWADYYISHAVWLKTLTHSLILNKIKERKISCNGFILKQKIYISVF